YMLPFYTMEVFIETLPGISFQLQVSPFEAVKCVKVRIQRLRGIPVSQQHLMWNNIELEDESSLKDYNISEGCTLKLVFAMRSGPINIRRVPLEEPLREKTEYISPMQDELWEKTPSNKRVILVYQDGDEMKFLRVINDLTLSDSSSGGSVYNFNNEDDDDVTEAFLTGQQMVENSITMNKMKLLKSKMESMNLNKPKKSSKLKPRPPMAPRLSSTLMTSTRHKFLKVLPNIGQSCLPPGNLPPSESSHSSLSLLTSAATKQTITSDYINKDHGYTTSLNRIVLPPRIPKVKLENDSHSKNFILPPVSAFIQNEEFTEDDLALHQNMNFFTSDENPMPIGLLNEVGSSEQDGEIFQLGKVKTEFGVFDGYKDHRTTETPSNTLSKSLNSGLVENSLLNREELAPRKTFLSPIQCPTQMTPNAFPKAQKQRNLYDFESLRPTASHMFHSLEFRNMTDASFSRTRFQGLKVDSPGKTSGDFSNMGIKDLKEMVEKSESVDALTNLDFFASLARSKDNLHGSSNHDRLHGSNSPTCSLQNRFEARFKRLSPLKDNAELFVSILFGYSDAELHFPGLFEATRLFPPVNSTIHSKKKVTKHCLVCRKKTGLATSFDCRCGHNFCAAHRYAETHNCPYDYKAAGKRYLQEAYPVVSAPKLPKI
uniref:Zinc finger AN1-type containing 4 n=1 Tax=Leptobrachium leishanense TaxID=445787 RepID=A0A8C5QLI2_9ANUR